MQGKKDRSFLRTAIEAIRRKKGDEEDYKQFVKNKTADYNRSLGKALVSKLKTEIRNGNAYIRKEGNISIISVSESIEVIKGGGLTCHDERSLFIDRNIIREVLIEEFKQLGFDEVSVYMPLIEYIDKEFRQYKQEISARIAGKIKKR